MINQATDGSRRTWTARMAVVAVAVVTTLAAGAGTAVAQESEPSGCVTATFSGIRLTRAANVVARTPVVAVDLPAGVYDIPDASAFDSYPNRVNVTQLSEVWELEFIGADGSLVAVSGLSGDVPDRVETGTWQGAMGSVTLSAPAVGVRAHHRPRVFPDETPASVTPLFAQLCPVLPNGPTTSQPAPPTTVPSTTAPPTTAPPTTAPPTNVPPTTAPPTTGPPTTGNSSTTQAPVTTAAPTTSSPDGSTIDPPEASTTTSTEIPPLPPEATTTTLGAAQNDGTDDPELAVTGSETGWLVTAGVLLLGGGLGLIFATSRRRSLP